MNLSQHLEFAKANPSPVIRQAAPAHLEFRLFRITSDSPTTTTTSTTTSTTSTSTTSTSTTSTTTTTAPPCKGRVWRGIPIDAAFPRGAAAELVPLVTIERTQDPEYLFAPIALALQINDIVMAVNQNGQWWVVAVYGNCPQAGVTTTTTTSTTSTTTGTTPPPGYLP